MARKRKNEGGDLVAARSFQFRHVSGLVEVEQGDRVPVDHPAVRAHPDWFNDAPEGNTPDGEE